MSYSINRKNIATLVSVVIPAFNAEQTIARTIESACAQTHHNLEIIVVDDGSTDNTLAVADACAASDRRIKVIRSSNNGVAAARNLGIKMSHGSFIAPLDADDLWHPTKIEKQLAVFSNGGEAIGFVYTPFREIDQRDEILWSSGFSDIQGHAYLRSLLLNFVGNGSALLLRREAVSDVGAYELSFHQNGLQGTEDRFLQTEIARNWQVGVVPEYLTGYRVYPGRMSSDLVKMAKSHFYLYDLIKEKYPETPKKFLSFARGITHARLGVIYLRQGNLLSGSQHIAFSICESPLATASQLVKSMKNLGKKIGFVKDDFYGENKTKKKFKDIDPKYNINFKVGFPESVVIYMAKNQELSFLSKNK